MSKIVVGAVHGLGPLYTKLRKEKLLHVQARDTIYRLIQQTPGIHFVELQKQVGGLHGRANPIAFGALAYHLSQMERFEFIVSKREGRYRRYFDVAARIGADTARIALLQTRPVPIVARLILAHPGLSQRDLLARVVAEYPMRRQALAYHLRRLVGRELVARDPGRKGVYRATERLVRLADYVRPPPQSGPSAALTAPAA